MTLKYWATLSIVILSVILEYIWVWVALDVGYLHENELVSLLPWLIGAILSPFIIAGAITNILPIILSKKLNQNSLHRHINWIAFFVALIIFVIMAMKKVKIHKIPDQANNTSNVLISEESMTSIPNIFAQMKKECVKSHTPKDGFNKIQILAHCDCIIKDSKKDLSLKEIKIITKLLETSQSVFLKNTQIAKIVIQCISETDAQSL